MLFKCISFISVSISIVCFFSNCYALDKNEIEVWIDSQSIKMIDSKDGRNWSLTFSIKNISNHKVCLVKPLISAEIGKLKIIRKDSAIEHTYQKISTKEDASSEISIIGPSDTLKSVLNFIDICDTTAFKTEFENELNKTCRTIIIKTKDKELKSEIRAKTEKELFIRIDSLKSKYLKTLGVENVAVVSCGFPQGYFTEWVELESKKKYGDLMCNENDSIAIEYSNSLRSAKANRLWQGKIRTSFLALRDIPRGR